MEGDTSVTGELLAMAREEQIPAWRSVLLSLLTPAMDRDEVFRFAGESLDHEHPLVRSAAVRALRTQQRGLPLLEPMLKDPVRMVRVDAQLGLLNQLPKDSESYKELRAYADHLADQAQGLMLQVEIALSENRLQDAEKWARRAAEWDPVTGYFQYILGSVLNYQGRNREAAAAMEKAEQQDPENPQHAYSLALIYAEMGQVDAAIAALKRALKTDPQFHRAWYNLGLAYAQKNELAEGIAAVLKAENLAAGIPNYPYARATLHARQGDLDQARRAAEKALAQDPNYAPAFQFLQSLDAQP
jgi:tetratricopeptide (TPR) repeat protein